MTKPSLVRGARSTWKRFREDDRSSAQGGWALMMIAFWIAVESLILSFYRI